MFINSISSLAEQVSAKKSDFEVAQDAFELCDEVREGQISGSGTDWSIAVTYGWLAIITNFNHKIHRLFMSQESKDREDLRHLIATEYIVKTTDAVNIYKLVLKK